MKQNKTNAKLLGELSSTKRNEVELILEKKVPKNANKGCETSCLKREKQRAGLQASKGENVKRGDRTQWSLGESPTNGVATSG